MHHRIGIVGASCNGVSVLGNILRHASSTVDSITLIDPRPPGGGPVFNPESDLLLCNTSAAIGSLISEEPDDFLHYLADRGLPAKSEAYVPRDLVGDYARAHYEDYAELAAARGIKVSHYPARANSIHHRDDGGYQIRLDDGSSQEFDRVVICVGFAGTKLANGFTTYTRHPRFVPSPFPVTRLRQRVVSRDGHILVLGAGQSAVDAAIALCHEGHRVTLASRSGVLPAVRNRFLAPPVDLPSPARLAELDPDDPLLSQKLNRIVVEAVRAITPIPLRHQVSFATDPIQRLREEIELVAAGRCGWQDITFAMMSQLNVWAAGLPGGVRASLLASHRRVGWRYLTSLALRNAERLLRYADAGQLRVDAYDPTSVTAHGSGFEVQTRRYGQDRFDYAVNAAGFRVPQLYVDDRTLYLRGQPATATLLSHLDRTLRVRLTPDSPPEGIWLVGQTTYIRSIFPNFLPTAVTQATEVARQLATI